LSNEPSAPRPEAQDDLQELLRLMDEPGLPPKAEKAPAPPRGASGGYGELVKEWAEAHEVAPGTHAGALGETLYKHFTEWCQMTGRRGYEMTPVRWGACLTGVLHLEKGRYFKHGKDYRPRTMTRKAADYFRQWEEDHPPTGDFSTNNFGRVNTKPLPDMTHPDEVREGEGSREG
jgi:hypothetical protein